MRIAGAVGHLRLNRPEKLNAMDAEMVDELAARCREIEHHADIRVLILSGEGKAFCAGGDIEAWSSEGPERFGRHWVRDGHAAFDALARLRQPVIAVLEGHALGGGLRPCLGRPAAGPRKPGRGDPARRTGRGLGYRDQRGRLFRCLRPADRGRGGRGPAPVRRAEPSPARGYLFHLRQP